MFCLGSVLRERLNQLKRDSEFSKTKLQEQYEKELEKLETNKKGLERKVSLWYFIRAVYYPLLMIRLEIDLIID